MNAARLYRDALANHRSGRLVEASVGYEKALAKDPANADVLHMYAVLCGQLGRTVEANKLMDRACSRLSDNLPFQLNRAALKKVVGDINGALEAYRAATLIDARSVESFRGLAEVLYRLGRTREAIDALRWAIELDGGQAEVHALLGEMLCEEGRLREACESYRQALRVSPSNAAWHNHLGVILLRLSESNQALQSFYEAVRLKADFAAAYSNIGSIFHARRKFSEAVVWHRKSVQADPTYAPGFANLGSALRELGSFDEALSMYERATSIDEQYADARFNKSLLLLQQGRFIEGWRLYESRFQCQSLRLRLPVSADRVWDGTQSLEGRTIVLLAEQGLGDTLQFVRFVHSPRFSRAKVILYLPARLIPLLQRSFPELQFVSTDSAVPVCDWVYPLMSLPLALGITLETVPNDVPYLKGDPAKTLKWRENFSNEFFNIGIVWQGSRDSAVDSGRSFPASRFKAIAAVPGVRLHSLQKLESNEKTDFSVVECDIQDFGESLDAEGSFLDSAAIINHLDLVISSDTAIAHLAGALNARVYVALKSVPDWRWLLHREDSPWYPSMKLFRQTTLDDWDPVFAQIETSVRVLVDEKRKRLEAHV